MKEKIITLATIRDYILEWFPDLLWWDGYHKYEPFNSQRSYKHRQGMPNEIRIEFDSDNYEENWVNVNLTAIKLTEMNISFAIYYVEGGRSPHIHIYDLDELETLEYDDRTKYREKFLNSVCPKDSNPDKALCDEKHLCALEFANHFKYNKPKRLLAYFWNGRNMGIDFSLKMELKETKGKKTIQGKSGQTKFGDIIRKKKRDLIIENLTFEQVFDKYGVHYRGTMACCPFHADGNNSLSFTNANGLWKCWGAECGAKGDIITLIKMLEELKNGQGE